MATVKVVSTQVKKIDNVKITKPILIAALQKFDEFKDKKVSALMQLKREVLVSYLNRVKGVEDTEVPAIDSEMLEELKIQATLPKVPKSKETKTSQRTPNMTSDLDFEGEILATEEDLLHFDWKGKND